MHPNPFGWLGPNYKKNSPEKSNLNLTKMFWARPKHYGPDQNKLYPSKTIWMVQNNFGPIEGQGIKHVFLKKTDCVTILLRNSQIPLV